MESLEDLLVRLRTMEAPLNERLRLYSEALKRVEPHYASAYDALVARLAAARSGSGAPAAGDLMPPFALPDGNLQIHQLDEYLDQGPVVVSFNRGHWCPYCMVELSAFKQGLKRIARSGAAVVSIMPEMSEFVARVAAEVDHTFEVLSDKNNGYALSCDLVIWLGTEIRELFRADRIDIDIYQQNDAAFVPIPATFVIGRDGRIARRFVDPDFRKRMEIDEIVAAVEEAASYGA